MAPIGLSQGGSRQFYFGGAMHNNGDSKISMTSLHNVLSLNKILKKNTMILVLREPFGLV